MPDRADDDLQRALEEMFGEDGQAPVNLTELGARAVRVFGGFAGEGSKVLVEMPRETFEALADESLDDVERAEVVDGALRDIAAVRAKDVDLGTSSIAYAVIEMAKQLASPFNSATSKSLCAGKLDDLLARLRDLLPDEDPEDDLTAIKNG